MPSVVFKKPGTGKYTLDTSVASAFDGRQSQQILTLQKGQTIKFRCFVKMVTKLMVLDKCVLE